MSRVYVCGLGAVTPAGWQVSALREVLDKGQPLPVHPLPRPGWTKPLLSRLVPNPAQRLDFLAHPRLRRASPITHYAASAALEATSRLPAGLRLGVVVCLQSGCIQYSFRFFEEVLKDASTASPLLFAETVFAAPASHVAALLPRSTKVETLLGDPASFLQGIVLGSQWLAEQCVDACLVIGAEEINWLLTDALWHLEHSAIVSGGAGAICLCSDPALSLGVELSSVTDIHTYGPHLDRAHAAQAMRDQLPSGSQDCLLCDGLHDSPRTDTPELAAWRDWSGPRISPKHILGEGLMAAAAWQCVAACDAVANGRYSTSIVSLVGSNQHAVGALFTHA